MDVFNARATVSLSSGRDSTFVKIYIRQADSGSGCLTTDIPSSHCDNTQGQVRTKTRLHAWF